MDVEHTVFLLSNDSLSSKRDVGGHAKILMPRNHSAEGVRNFRSGIFRVAGGVRSFWRYKFRVAGGVRNFRSGHFRVAGSAGSVWNGLRSLADTDAFMSGA